MNAIPAPAPRPHRPLAAVHTPVPYPESFREMPSPQRACCDSTTDELHTDRCTFPHGIAGIDIPRDPGGFTDDA